MANYTITEAAEFVGEWFLPRGDQPRNPIAGTLSWTGQRASLQLHDTFEALHGTIFGDDQHSYPVIHGTTLKCQAVSLLDASRAGTGLTIGQTGMRQAERIISSWIIVGAHVNPDTRYQELRVRIPGLMVWLGRGGARQTFLEKTSETPSNMIYQVEGVAEEITPLPSIAASLGWGIDRQFAGNLMTEISVTSSAALRIASESPQTLEWFFKQLGKATTLLSFLTGSAMAPDQVTAKCTSGGQKVEILVALREAKCSAYTKGDDFFMLRGGMEAELNAIFARWFEQYDAIALPSQLALSVLLSKGLWLHVEFLSLMQAFEGMHRATMGGLYMAESDYEPIAKTLAMAIPQSVGSDHRDALKSRIKYGNEVSLRKRLDAIINRLDLPLRTKLLGGDGTIPRAWIDTRNYYTHWDEGARETAMEPLDMHRACARLRLLLRTLYLDHVGIPQSAISHALDNACDESQYLIQLNAAEHRKKHQGSQAGAIMHVEVKDAGSPRESTS